MNNLDLISEAIGYIERIDTESCLKELAINRMKQFVLLNTPTQKGGKVKIYDWVGKENYRPNLRACITMPRTRLRLLPILML